MILKFFENQEKLIDHLFDKATEGRTSWAYGYRTHPVTQTLQFHNGIDIAAPEGTPILLPVSAQLVKKWVDDLNGNALRFRFLTYPDLYEIGLAHLKNFPPIEIDHIYPQGETIGFVGQTGRSTGPHLHLTCYKLVGGVFKTVDPLPYLTDREIDHRPEV